MKRETLSDQVGKPVVLSVHDDLDRVAESVITNRVISKVGVVWEPDADSQARRRNRLSPAVHQLCSVGFGPDPIVDLLARAARWAVVHYSLAGRLVGQMGLVVPVVERLAEVDHPEHEQENQRKDEDELDQRNAALVRREAAPAVENPPSLRSPTHRATLDAACRAIEEVDQVRSDERQHGDRHYRDQRDDQGVLDKRLAFLSGQSRPDRIKHALPPFAPHRTSRPRAAISSPTMILRFPRLVAHPRKAWATHPFGEPRKRPRRAEAQTATRRGGGRQETAMLAAGLLRERLPRHSNRERRARRSRCSAR